MSRRLTPIRNATVLLELDGQRFLVDPMLDYIGARPAVVLLVLGTASEGLVPWMVAGRQAEAA